MGVVTYELKRRILMVMTGCYFLSGSALCYAAYTMIETSAVTEAALIDDKNFVKTQTFYAMSLIFGFVVGGITQIIGFVGAWRENMCLLITYAVLMVSTGLTTLTQVFEEWIFSFTLIVWLFCFVTMITFIRELRQKRKALQEQSSTVYFVKS